MKRTDSTRLPTTSDAGQKRRKKETQLRQVWRHIRKHKLVMAALCVIIALLLMVALADFIVPYEMAVRQDPALKLASPSLEHPFGGDALGRDLFARIIHGSRVTFLLGFGATIIATTLATFFGASAAYIGGRYDNYLMRFMDMIITIPAILLAIAIAAGFGVGIPQLIIAISIPQTAAVSRVIRSAVLNVVGQEFIEAAKAIGIGNLSIIFKHIIPNVIGLILIQATMEAATNMLMGAALGFLGLGAPIPTPEWGLIMKDGLQYLRYSYHTVLITTFFLAVTALSINIFGDGLRDALDPRLKGRA
ncbi:MAG: ABC transporter permease [Deltaproteobacteria bacterium]|nr:ABC transporter permease [Deltaproteobacteria bacterium]